MKTRQPPRSNLLGWLLQRPWTLCALVLINLAGAAYGFVWYGGQLFATPWYYWPFTPECPIQAMLFAAVLILRMGNCPSAFLETLTFLGLIKYGTWTVGIIAHYWLTGGTTDITNIGLFLSHIGMALQGLIFLPLLSPVRYLGFLVGPWFLTMDLLDYVAGIHPYFPGGDIQHSVAVALASLGTILAIAYTAPWLFSDSRTRTGLPKPR